MALNDGIRYPKKESNKAPFGMLTLNSPLFFKILHGLFSMTWQNNKYSSASYRLTSHFAKDGGKVNPHRSKVKVSKGKS